MTVKTVTVTKTVCDGCGKPIERGQSAVIAQSWVFGEDGPTAVDPYTGGKRHYHTRIGRDWCWVRPDDRIGYPAYRKDF